MKNSIVLRIYLSIRGRKFEARNLVMTNVFGTSEVLDFRNMQI